MAESSSAGSSNAGFGARLATKSGKPQQRGERTVSGQYTVHWMHPKRGQSGSTITCGFSVFWSQVHLDRLADETHGRDRKRLVLETFSDKVKLHPGASFLYYT